MILIYPGFQMLLNWIMKLFKYLTTKCWSDQNKGKKKEKQIADPHRNLIPTNRSNNIFASGVFIAGISDHCPSSPCSLSRVPVYSICCPPLSVSSGQCLQTCRASTTYWSVAVAVTGLPSISSCFSSLMRWLPGKPACLLSSILRLTRPAQTPMLVPRAAPMTTPALITAPQSVPAAKATSARVARAPASSKSDSSDAREPRLRPPL